jgi:hypothetical protein
MEKDSIVGPVAYSLIGAGVGISIGMLFFSQGSSERGRIGFESSVPLAMGGACIGGAIGLSIAAAYRRFEHGRPIIQVLTTTLLWVAIGAPMGWLAGDIRSTNIVNHSQLTRLGMLYGAVSSAAVGLLSGLWVLWRTRQRPEGE